MASKENIYSSIQNLYNMDKTTWQEVLAELYNLVYQCELDNENIQYKIDNLLNNDIRAEVLRKLIELKEDGTLYSLISGENKYILPIASSSRLGGIKIGANLSIDSNGVLSAISSNGSNGSNGSVNITISNTLDNYAGLTLNDKMVAMFNDINTNYKNTPMLITLPSGNIEITQDLTAIGWTNKIFKCEGILYFNNCNAIEFNQCQHNDIYIHRRFYDKQYALLYRT